MSFQHLRFFNFCLILFFYLFFLFLPQIPKLFIYMYLFQCSFFLALVSPFLSISLSSVPPSPPLCYALVSRGLWADLVRERCVEMTERAKERKEKRGTDSPNLVSCQALDDDPVHYQIQCHPLRGAMRGGLIKVPICKCPLLPKGQWPCHYPGLYKEPNTKVVPGDISFPR